jgi:hypothetical protein
MSLLLSPRQQVAQAAQWRFRDHVRNCAEEEAGRPCREGRHLDAVAAGLWARAEQRKAVTA